MRPTARYIVLGLALTGCAGTAMTAYDAALSTQPLEFMVSRDSAAAMWNRAGAWFTLPNSPPLDASARDSGDKLLQSLPTGPTEIIFTVTRMPVGDSIRFAVRYIERKVRALDALGMPNDYGALRKTRQLAYYIVTGRTEADVEQEPQERGDASTTR